MDIAHSTLEVHSQIGSKNATIHSFMIMSMISMSGQLMELLYVKSQETHSKMKSYYFPDNTIIPSGIVAFPGSSVIMNNYDLKIFLHQVLFEQ